MNNHASLEKSWTKIYSERGAWESRALVAEDKVTALEEKYSGLLKKKQIEFKNLIGVYHQSEDFIKLMDDHDDEMRPVNMSLGWNKAVGVIHRPHPDIVNPSDYPSPWGVEMVVDVGQASGSGPKAVPQGPGSSSSHRSSGSKGKAPMKEGPAPRRPL